MSEKFEPRIEGEEKEHKPVPSELREKAIGKILEKNPKMEEHTKEQMKDQMTRNGRWGTCVDCPDAEGRKYGDNRDMYKVFPEKCPNTDRYDHWLGVDVLEN